ncbi:PspC domain-containing protein [uncultured Methanoregula sp.]|uniref:PspC domain-containing protein n=1 Tax=uncultured Methanoregula sp. TaxID=1005933 RepID=UPI002AABEE1E|nr:PspC domain-containing protein [uncultured Methanoregula sp.]
MKQLTRPVTGRMLAGVCAGIGEHLDVDPTVVRLVWAALTILSLGTGVLVYIIAWILIPEVPQDPTVTLPPA